MTGTVVLEKERPESRGWDSLVLAVCLIVAFGLRLGVILNQPGELTRDRDVYLATAMGVVEGRGYSVPNSSVPTAFRPPVYPLCLAAGLYGFPPPVAVAGINLLSGLLTVWFTASVGAWLQLGRLRFVAAFLVAADPLLLRYSSQPMTESLCAFLAVFWLWSMINRLPALGRRPRLHALIIGLALGLLVLSRPTFWPIACFCGLGWLIAWRKTGDARERTRISHLQTGICGVLGTLIVVTPWLVRNWLVFSVPILTTTHGGYTLLLGNNPAFYNDVVRQPWGTVWPDASQRDWEASMKSQMERALGPRATDVQTDAWQSRQARSYMAAEPGHLIAACIHRLRSLWNTVPQGETSGATSGSVIAVIGWFYIVVLASGFVGACLVIRRGDLNRWWPLYALIVSVQLVHLFYWTNTRMRAPLMPAVALVVAAAVSQHRPKLDERRASGLLA